MADRTHEVEDELTGAKASAQQGDAGETKPAAPGAYQEGSVESIGQRPEGEDLDDRTGEGQGRGIGRREEGRPPDEFVSSEVNDRTARPGRDSKTRS
jgi:hypothetical protein